jgi:hypothetical protein
MYSEQTHLQEPDEEPPRTDSSQPCELCGVPIPTTVRDHQNGDPLRVCQHCVSALPATIQPDIPSIHTQDVVTSSVHPSQPSSPECIPARPRTILTGTLIGTSGCQGVFTGCLQDLQEGQTVRVYAYRITDSHDLDVARCYCPECGPDRIVGPTLGATEVLATARLGIRSRPATRTHRLCLDEVSTIGVSPPTEGAQP